MLITYSLINDYELRISSVLLIDDWLFESWAFIIFTNSVNDDLHIRVRIQKDNIAIDVYAVTELTLTL